MISDNKQTNLSFSPIGYKLYVIVAPLSSKTLYFYFWYLNIRYLNINFKISPIWFALGIQNLWFCWLPIIAETFLPFLHYRFILFYLLFSFWYSIFPWCVIWKIFYYSSLFILFTSSLHSVLFAFLPWKFFLTRVQVHWFSSEGVSGIVWNTSKHSFCITVFLNFAIFKSNFKRIALGSYCYTLPTFSTIILTVATSDLFNEHFI